MSFRLNHAITIYTLAVAPLLTVAAHAATYYVATYGNDSDPGTEKEPWVTVAHAVTTMNAGDTTYVKRGTYNEGRIRFGKTGTSIAPIKLLNAPGESPTIHCINPSAFHRIEIQHERGGANPIGWITIEGFEIRNCWEAMKVKNIHDVTIRRNWMHHNLNQGILGSGTRVLIDRNIINHNGPFITKPTATGAHGIYGNGTAWTITNNLIYDNLGFGIQQNGSSSSFFKTSSHTSREFAVSENWVVANNTVAYNYNRAGMVVWGSTCNNVQIENNIFYENSVTLPSNTPQGVAFVSTACTGIQIRNNLFYASGAGGMDPLGLGATVNVHYVQSNNIMNVSAPGFVDAPTTLPSSPNFALTARSPAIDAGRSLDITKIAIDGTLRPQGRAYDIGAYEYASHVD
jgi:Right handed beta helix region